MTALMLLEAVRPPADAAARARELKAGHPWSFNQSIAPLRCQVKPPHHAGIQILRGVAMNTAAYRFPSDKDVDRIPALARPLLHFNLPDELRQLRTAPSWRRGTGRSSKTLVKYPDFHIVLVLMKSNTRTSRHHVDARISIHAIEGTLRFHLPDEVVEVSSGELYALDYAIPHEIEAIEESAFVLTISWPGGTKEERHAWKQSVS